MKLFGPSLPSFQYLSLLSQLASLSIEDPEDAELAYTMKDLPPPSGEKHPRRHTPVIDREPEATGMGPDLLPYTQKTSPLPRPTPCNPSGTPVTPPRPSRVPLETEFRPVQLRGHQLASVGSLDYPQSPSRPGSPWSRFDPYDSAEVGSRETGGRMESCGFGVMLFCLFSVVQDQDKEYVGFATLPNQVHRKSVKKGFAFTLMVAGE